MLVINAEFLQQFLGRQPPVVPSGCFVRIIRLDNYNIYHIFATDVLLDLPETHLLVQQPLSDEDLLEKAILHEVLIEENLQQEPLDEKSYSELGWIRHNNEQKYLRMKEVRQQHVKSWIAEHPDKVYPYLEMEKTTLSFSDNLQHLNVRNFGCTNVRLVLPESSYSLTITNSASHAEIMDRVLRAQRE